MNWHRSLMASAALTALSAVAVLPAAAAEAVTVATEGAYPPFNRTEADGTFSGFEIDLGGEICARAELDCTFVKQDFSGMIPALLAGRFDMIFSAMSINEERRQAGLFSIPYLTDSFRFYGAKGGDAAIPEDLPGKTVGVFTGSTGERFIGERWGSEVETRGYADIDQVNADLEAGRIDYGFNAQLPVDAFLKSEAGANYEFLGEPYSDPILGLGMGAMFRKDGGALKAKVDEAIRAVYADGTFERLSKEHFGAAVDVRADKLW